ncbi:MAG TPA: hypothetical protein VE844_06635, partial [Gammaproteobacteria bacterium]|nr:hypothetical protein [Gammaproteobacteria bacterium]
MPSDLLFCLACGEVGSNYSYLLRALLSPWRPMRAGAHADGHTSWLRNGITPAPSPVNAGSITTMPDVGADHI